MADKKLSGKSKLAEATPQSSSASQETENRAPKSKKKPEAWEIEFNDDIQGFGEEEKQTSSVLVEGPEGRSWRVAANVVNRLKPIPRLMWPMIHGVFGKPGDLGTPDAMMFSAVSQLIIRAAQDKTLAANAKGGENTKRSLTESLQIIGADVAAAICFIHAVCRRISTAVNERVSRPILDDALLRTHIGFYVGQLSSSCGAGRGMLAGFAGRCGLAVQIAAGDTEQAQRALTGMASGQDMSIVCSNVYGCDPLEVAALTLIAGGCCREIAFGVSSYSSKKVEVYPGSEQYRWLALFSVVESMRMAQADAIPRDYWSALGYDPAGKEELQQLILSSQRRGHGWQWVTQPQLNADKEPPKDPKAPPAAS